MLGIHHFGVFLASCILLNLTPGPDTLYILGRTIAQGRAAGVASALGISAGCLVHTFAAALGLSAVLAASATAFTAVKFAGAAYLIYLGARMLLSRQTTAATAPAEFSPATFLAIFRQGMLTNILNPKVALFFIAFLPQFIAADAPSKPAAFIALGLSFVTTGTLWCLSLAWFGAVLGDRLRTSTGAAAWLNRTAGALFVALGVRLAAAK
jgi:threonine/homoserine/homoserine lactone efflux protein